MAENFYEGETIRDPREALERLKILLDETLEVPEFDLELTKQKAAEIEALVKDLEHWFLNR
jgi:hypothetical protein